ncbi:hypothetical protein AVEN_169364-1 [Araneus ventricosus]|uniref:Uncharacterized protein n=1 Tax=Araneus ventricosus TaxID=182803 RepID=A0A4Y2JWJ6_ARAVE|nr:hypothetical protein AVEN_103820-1 [Araneus ventricosus]GBM94222.1 hypothetical protein AVEN_14135-1 [Araneus ventricosus]GBM94263.1 hypothetical protein AVEN_116164-1 [Araneus ventricosus]GBM94274.1 hypothetical protein AVEN_169364-1 [Araneus ventricosus]
MTRMAPELAPPSPNFRLTAEGVRFTRTYDLTGNTVTSESQLPFLSVECSSKVWYFAAEFNFSFGCGIHQKMLQTFGHSSARCPSKSEAIIVLFLLIDKSETILLLLASDPY